MPKHRGDTMTHTCDNCGKVYDDTDDLNTAENLNMRLEPGSIVPSGECPECGALCYPTGSYTYELPKEDLISLLEIARIGLIMAATPVSHEMDISDEEIERLKKVLDNYLEK